MDILTVSVPQDTPQISVSNIWKVFGDNHEGIDFSDPDQLLDKQAILEETGSVVAVGDVSFDVMPGETFVVMGLSGCGKSTLLRCLIRLVEPTSGVIKVGDFDVTELDFKSLTEFRRTKTALVFQNFGLFPHKSVVDNVAYGLEVQGVSKEERQSKSLEVLERVGLQGWENVYPAQLSGGMQQRAGLARALAVDPDILLMDEPFSALDPLIRRQMQDELVELQSQLRKSIIFITHDLEEAVKIGDRIAIMRDGKFIQVGTPKEIIMDPKDEFVQAFTKGVDRGLVVDVESISVKTDRTVSADSTLQDTSVLMDSLFAERLYVLGAGGSYKGVVSRDNIRSSLADGSTTTLEDIIESYEPIMGTNSVGELLPLLADQDFALPVVDENQIMNGIVRHKDVFAFMVESAKAQKEVDVDIQT